MSRRSDELRSLEDRCLVEIAKLPGPSLAPAKVQRALFSKRARALVSRSTDNAAAGQGKRVDTARLRQAIITKLIDEGRGIAGSFPAPPAFLDETFTAVSLASSKVGDTFICDTLSKRCPNLRSVDLTACFYIRDVSIEVLLQRCPHVERLSLRNCRKLTDLALDHVGESGKNVSALDIGGCFNMTAPGVDALCSTHPNRSSLTELDISGIGVTAETLEIICMHCGNIEVLRMGFIEYMEATLKQTLLPLVPQLRSLHVHWNSCITDAFLLWVAKNLPRLEDLNVYGCAAVSVDGVSDLLFDRQEAIKTNRPGMWSAIEKINVRYTSITKQDIEALQATFERTKIV